MTSIQQHRITFTSMVPTMMTMILNELATNAVKYGALSVPAGFLGGGGGGAVVGEPAGELADRPQVVTSQAPARPFVVASGAVLAFLWNLRDTDGQLLLSDGTRVEPRAKKAGA